MWLEKYAKEQPVLLPFQVKWINDNSHQKAGEKGRQEGFTWCEGLWSVLRRSDPTIKIDHYFSSADWITSKNFIRDCRMWAQAMNVLASHEYIRVEESTAESLTFPTGARIIALSSSPKAIRGKRGDVTLDEFSHHDDDDGMFAAAVPCTTWGGQLHIISTHNGAAKLFYKIVEDARLGRNDFSLHRVTLQDAVDEGLALKIPGKHLNYLPDIDRCNKAYVNGVRRSCTSEDIFQQEYMCEPLSASTLILPREYDACVAMAGSLAKVPDAFDFAQHYNELFIGVDVGRAKAITCIWVLERGYDTSPGVPESLRNVYRTVCAILLAGQDIKQQYAVLDPILRHPSVSGCAIDMGAIGRALSDLAQEDHGGIIEPLTMTNPKKAEIAERAKHFVQSQRVSLPDDQDIRQDVISLRRQVSKQKVITYDGQSNVGHCDTFWALGLALHAAEQNTPLSVAIVEREQREQLALPAA